LNFPTLSKSKKTNVHFSSEGGEIYCISQSHICTTLGFLEVPAEVAILSAALFLKKKTAAPAHPSNTTALDPATTPIDEF
jgi:hypothetical protein